MKPWDNLAPRGADERGSKPCMDTLTEVKAPDKTCLEAMKAIILEADIELAKAKGKQAVQLPMLPKGNPNESLAS